MPQAIEELTEIDQTVAENGLLKFHAPENMGVKKYDDVCDMLVALFHTMLEFKKEFGKLTPYKKRHDREKIFQRKLKQNRKKKQLMEAELDKQYQATNDGRRRPRQKSILGQTMGDW